MLSSVAHSGCFKALVNLTLILLGRFQLKVFYINSLRSFVRAERQCDEELCGLLCVC